MKEMELLCKDVLSIIESYVHKSQLSIVLNELINNPIKLTLIKNSMLSMETIVYQYRRYYYKHDRTDIHYILPYYYCIRSIGIGIHCSCKNSEYSNT